MLSPRWKVLLSQPPFSTGVMRSFAHCGNCVRISCFTSAASISIMLVAFTPERDVRFRSNRVGHDRAAIAACSPLPKGEGWGEGLQSIERSNPLTPSLSPTELGFTRVRSPNDEAEVGNIRLRL